MSPPAQLALALCSLRALVGGRDSFIQTALLILQVKESVLQVQRRMQPAISALIRKEVYPNLLDGANVLSHPPVAGGARQIFGQILQQPLHAVAPVHCS